MSLDNSYFYTDGSCLVSEMLQKGTLLVNCFCSIAKWLEMGKTYIYRFVLCMEDTVLPEQCIHVLNSSLLHVAAIGEQCQENGSKKCVARISDHISYHWTTENCGEHPPLPNDTWRYQTWQSSHPIIVSSIILYLPSTHSPLFAWCW